MLIVPASLLTSRVGAYISTLPDFFQCSSLRIDNKASNNNILWNEWMGLNSLNGFTY